MLFSLTANAGYKASQIKQPLGKENNTRETVAACISPRWYRIAHNDRVAIEKKLGFVASASGLCGGHYQESPITFEPSYKVMADNVSLTMVGRSKLSGRVKIAKGKQLMSADVAYLYRNKQKVTRIVLEGQVRLLEPGHLVVANAGTINPETKAGHLEEALYRFGLHSYSAWGQACRIVRDEQGNYQLSSVSYTVCPPRNPTWHLKANQLSLDKKESTGTAKKAVLYLWQLPVAYFPYISFPLDKSRKSGFLIPSLHYTSQSGFDFQLPYYVNLAPNYDLTLKPQYFSLRGLMLGGQFRYLLPWAHGVIEANYLPSDRVFKKFRLANAAVAPSLLNLNNQRYSLKLSQQLLLPFDWRLDIHYQKVSDDYYLQDFTNNMTRLSTNQLEQRLELYKETYHWTYKLLLQGYQTLSPFNQSVVTDIYTRFPALKIYGEYLKLPASMFITFLAQFDNFQWSGAATMPEGNRYHLLPTIGINKQYSWGYIKPVFSLHSTYYTLGKYNLWQNQNFTRVVPIVSIDEGLRFERMLNKTWLQTLEPRLYYLYVPYKAQGQIPIFDSYIFTSSFNQLFRNNRFSGVDRIGDANHLSFAISSRFLSMVTGVQRLRLSVGGQYRFKTEQVSLCQTFGQTNCSLNTDLPGSVSGAKGFAPLQGEMELAMNSKLSLLGNVAWDIARRQNNNALLSFHYQPRQNHIFNIGYGFYRNGDNVLQTTAVDNLSNLHQIRLAYAWSLNNHWQSIGAYSYNFSHRFPMSYLFGMQYDSCCSAVRLLAGRAYLFYTSTGALTYGNNVYIQFVLKGLGGVGTSSPSAVINNFLPNYQDQFK